ncbi:MAG: class F sortase, partial [Actinomycetota bacterium]
HAPHLMTTISLALVVMVWGCAQPSGDRDVAASDADPVTATTEDPRNEDDGEHDDRSSELHAGHADDADDVGAPSDGGGPPTAEEIAAAFAPHADAHSSHTGAHASSAPGTANRDFPEGIDPARVRIPAIGVDADVTELSLAGAEPEVPEDFDQVGWYVQTREPGEIGPAVLAGHVDSREGPAVFVDLGNLQPGDTISVTDDAGDERQFVVDELGQYPKDDLPEEVLGFADPIPQLRLITCGGSFDRSTGHYRDNIVVYASLTDA